MLRTRVVAVSTEALVILNIDFAEKKRSGPTLARLLPVSVLAFIWPPASGIWRGSTVSRAFVVAIVNTICAFAWVYLIALAATIWMAPPTRVISSPITRHARSAGAARPRRD